MTYYTGMTVEATKDWDFITIKESSILRYDLCLDVLAKIDQFDLPPGYLSKERDEEK